jgi:site-specific DNA-methyltransferase (adenine-specific)
MGCVDTKSVCSDCVRADLVSKYAEAPMLGQQSQNWHESETHSRGYADNDPHQFEEWCLLWLEQCWRVLKPGGHLVAFGGTRT